MDFAEHLRKSNDSENSKVMVDPYDMEFMKGTVILVKVEEMYNIFKSALPLFIGRKMRMELDDQSFCWSLPLNVHMFTPPFLY